MKRILLWLCTAALICTAAPCHARSVGTSAASAMLMDAATGQVLYEHNAHEKRPIASTTKLLTALVALEQGRDKTVTVAQRHMAEGSSMYLKAGERVTTEALLYGLLLQSGNDAALALAEATSGSVDAFVGEMNRTAQAIGMTDSHFMNPNGLDTDGHYSTAYDMALLASKAVQNPALLRIASTKEAHVGGRTFRNHNRLLRQTEGCIGLKTGYTQRAGRTLVSAAVRDGQILVAVTLRDGDDWRDHEALYEYGFAQIAKPQRGDAP